MVSPSPRRAWFTKTRHISCVEMSTVHIARQHMHAFFARTGLKPPLTIDDSTTSGESTPARRHVSNHQRRPPAAGVGTLSPLFALHFGASFGSRLLPFDLFSALVIWMAIMARLDYLVRSRNGGQITRDPKGKLKVEIIR
jgi:hypothetical protein